MNLKLWTGALALGLLLFALTPVSSAAVIGTLRIGSDGQVIVDQDTIDFQPPAGLNDGPIITTDDTLTYNNGTTLAIGETGRIKDLDFVIAPPPVMEWLTFDNIPELDFHLGSLGAGSSNTNCAGLAIGQSCSVFAGSPFVLTRTATGTAVSLTVFGTVTDATAISSNFIGTLSNPLTGRTPESIQTNILAGGSETSPFSGDFVVTVIPEPGTISMLLGGGLLLALGGRRLRRS